MLWLLMSAVSSSHARVTVTLETQNVNTMGKSRWWRTSRDGNAQYVQRQLEVLLIRRSVLVGRDYGGSSGGSGITVEYHRKTLGDPLGRGDPHNRHGALDLDDPEMKLS